jgi:hypothetical protein
MYPFPPPPDVPDDQRAQARVSLRYEDITQDGRLAMEALAPALGEVVWRQLLIPGPHVPAMSRAGIIPILSRLVIEGCGGPFSTQHPIDATGRYQLAHAVGESGQVERLLVNMWVEASLPIGRNFGPKPEGAGRSILAGRLFGEHVLTRLFAPPDQRKVVELDLPGVPRLPGARVALVRPESVIAMPEGATPLDSAPRPDPVIIPFGLAHTDSNQHVNSLVYPRMFEDAALRRFAEHDRAKPPVLARFVEAAFRKPCFAGERYAIVLQAFTHGGELGAIGAFVSEADAAKPLSEARAHCYVRMFFER